MLRAQSPLLSVGAALAVMLVGVGQTRADETRRARLDYLVEAGVQDCLDADELKDAVAARLGYVPFSDEASLSLRVRVRANASGLAAELRVKDASGERSRSLGSATRDCPELSRSLALAISVAIDPMSLTRAPDPPLSDAPPEALGASNSATSAPVVSQGPPRLVESAPPAELDRLRPPAHAALPWRLRWLATGHAAFLTVPGPTGGMSIGLGVRRGRLWSDVELRYDLPRSRSADAGGSVRAALLAGVFTGCYGGFSVGVCALGLVGRLAGEGREVDVPKKAASLLAGLGLRASLELPVSRALSLRAHVDGLYVATSTRLQLRGSSVWETSPLALVPGVGFMGEL